MAYEKLAVAALSLALFLLAGSDGSAARALEMTAQSERGTGASQATVGMPFTGRWAYNVIVKPPYRDKNSSHPSVHAAPGGGDWATDLYAAVGTPVKLHVTSTDGVVTFSWHGSSTSCGTSTMLNIDVGGRRLGTLYVAHLEAATTSGPITNGMTLGTVADFGPCNARHHIHIELRNASVSTHSCWIDKGSAGTIVSEGSPIGRLGSPTKADKQSCASASAGSPFDGLAVRAVLRPTIPVGTGSRCVPGSAFQALQTISVKTISQSRKGFAVEPGPSVTQPSTSGGLWVTFIVDRSRLVSGVQFGLTATGNGQKWKILGRSDFLYGRCSLRTPPRSEGSGMRVPAFWTAGAGPSGANPTYFGCALAFVSPQATGEQLVTITIKHGDPRNKSSAIPYRRCPY